MYRLTPHRHTALRRIATQYDGCRVQELVDVAIDELIAAHKPAKRTKPKRPPVTAAPPPPPPPAPPPAVKTPRTYKPRACECGAQFVPTAPRDATCPQCRGVKVPAAALESSTVAPSSAAADEDRFEKVWDGTAGRQGVPIPRH